MQVSSRQSATAYGYSQIQRQQAERNAKQLESQATALATQAATARRDADNAQQRAGDLEGRANNARTSASSAKQAVASSQAAVQTGKTIGRQADQVAKALQTANGTSATNTQATLYTSQGESTSAGSYQAGTLVNTTE
jgi:hypothetical protein